MVHSGRVYCVAVCESAEDLAERITRCTWTLCTAFRLGDLLLCNDSFSEDSAQEYAVFHGGKQVESITFGWMDRAEALISIKSLEAGAFVGFIRGRLPRLDHGEGCCELCA